MDIIEEIIAKKPYLEQPLRFYEKSVLFTDAVKALAMPLDQGLNAYPREYIGRIVECFVSLFDMPAGSLAPLKQALELGEIDFTRLPLLEVPSFSLPYPEDDLMTLLFLISRPFFLQMHDVERCGDPIQGEGRCPVCCARPSILSIMSDGMHVWHCSFCGAKGRANAIDCTVCRNNDALLMSTFSIKKENGFSARACCSCKAYVKTSDAGLLERMTPDLADLMSLTLDIMVQEKGFKRLSPNPIGMVRMSASG
jgi:FdhE protein